MTNADRCIDRAEILRLCNEIEDMINALYFSRGNSIYYDERNAIIEKLKEIGKELTGDAGSKTD